MKANAIVVVLVMTFLFATVAFAGYVYNSGEICLTKPAGLPSSQDPQCIPEACKRSGNADDPHWYLKKGTAYTICATNESETCKESDGVYPDMHDVQCAVTYRYETQTDCLADIGGSVSQRDMSTNPPCKP